MTSQADEEKRGYYCWTDKRNEYLRRRYPDTDTKEIAEHLGVTRHKVTMQAFRLGVKKSQAAYLRRVWSREDIAYVKSNYAHTDAGEIAKKLGVSRKAVHQRAYHLGVKRAIRSKAEVSANNYEDRTGQKATGKSTSRGMIIDLLDEYQGRYFCDSQIAFTLDIPVEAVRTAIGRIVKEPGYEGETRMSDGTSNTRLYVRRAPTLPKVGALETAIWRMITNRRFGNASINCTN